MKQTLAAILLFFLGTGPTQAWNTPLHMAVVELALDQLSDRQAQAINDIAYDLVVEFDQQRRLTLMRRYPGTSWLAQIAVMPDMDRSMTLDELFLHYGAELPPALADLRLQDTAGWHFINRALDGDPAVAQCELAGPVNLVSVFPLLLQAYSGATTDKERALLLAFIVHLTADAHQPLHNLTQADASCQHDAGGNGFCAVRRQPTQRCETTLHQTWDSALGFAEDLELVEEMARRIGAAKAQPEREPVLDFAAWSDESYRFGQFVYATSVDRLPDPSYIREGRAISAEQLRLAAMRLALLLSTL